MISQRQMGPHELPELVWIPQPGEAHYDPSTETLRLIAGPYVDWANDSQGIEYGHEASCLGFPVLGDFSLSARVRVEGSRSTFDAGALAVWIGPDRWAKLCFEWSPAAEPMVVSVVTNDWSDDCNSVVVAPDGVRLRVSRCESAWAFHYSVDGIVWRFVRLFRLHSADVAHVGFLAQAPVGDGCTALFDEIRYEDKPPSDLRGGG